MFGDRLRGLSLLAGAACVLLSGCTASEPAIEPGAPLRVSVLTLEPAPFVATQTLPGRVAAVRMAQIRPQVGGIVQRRLFEQGSEVEAGTALFQIHAAPFKAEVDTAAAALRRAQAEATRTRVHSERLHALAQARVVSRQAYDDGVAQREQAAADVAQAQANLARKRLDLGFARVEAPIAGRIDQSVVSEGALVAPTDATPMATIQQIDQVYVDVRRPSATLARLREVASVGARSAEAGIPVQILLREGDASTLAGRLLFSGIDVDAGTGDVLLRVLVDNPARVLLPGMYVQARMTEAAYPDALTVPQEAIVRAGGRAGVWTIDARAQAYFTPVELGELVAGRYRIASGLKPGQQVAVQGIERLQDGAAVEAHPFVVAQPSAAAAAAAR